MVICMEPVMKLELDEDIPNLAVFTGVVNREPMIGDRPSGKVMNFYLSVTIKDFGGNSRTFHADCTSWGDDRVAEDGATIAMAMKSGKKLMVIGASVPGAYPSKAPPYKPIGVTRISVKQIMIVGAEDAGKAAESPAGKKKPSKEKPVAAASRKAAAPASQAKPAKPSQKAGKKQAAPRSPK